VSKHATVHPSKVLSSGTLSVVVEVERDDNNQYVIIIKTNGTAMGKGVTVTESTAEALDTVAQYLGLIK
jgi:phosphoribosylamine-glycine ligase